MNEVWSISASERSTVNPGPTEKGAAGVHVSGRGSGSCWILAGPSILMPHVQMRKSWLREMPSVAQGHGAVCQWWSHATIPGGLTSEPAHLPTESSLEGLRGPY